MRCHICNASLSEPNFNSDHGSYEPCGTCLAVIQDTLDGYTDSPAAAEDELGGPDPILTANLRGEALPGLYDDYTGVVDFT